MMGVHFCRQSVFNLNNELLEHGIHHRHHHHRCGLSFIGGLLSGAEAAADGCGKVIGFIVVAALIIAWILGLF